VCVSLRIRVRDSALCWGFTELAVSVVLGWEALQWLHQSDLVYLVCVHTRRTCGACSLLPQFSNILHVHANASFQPALIGFGSYSEGKLR
jgi:hypothetical protein